MTRNYTETIDDKVLSILSLGKQQIARIQVKGLLDFLVSERIQKLLIQLIVGIYIAFIIVKHLVFLALLEMFFTIVVPPTEGNWRNDDYVSTFRFVDI